MSQYLHVIDAIIALVAIEAIALSILYRTTGRGIAPAKFLPNLAAGVALFLALRVVLADGPWSFVALCLLISLAAHLADLATRWHARAPSTAARVEQVPIQNAPLFKS